MDISAVQQVARAAAASAGEVLRDYFGKRIGVRSKSGPDMVSEADLRAEQAVAEEIRRVFPSHAILGEEEQKGDHNAHDLWIVDPLDGTTNYLHGLPQFAVSIAYYQAGQPVCGVVHHPLRDEWYTATRGGGAFFNGEAVRVSEDRKLSDVLIGLGFYYDRGVMMEATLSAIRDLFGQEIHGVRRMGAASLDLCYVGMGMFGGFFEYQLSAWDFAAGRLFIEEAGGKVTTCRGTPLPIGRSTVLASNGYLHDRLLEIVKKHHPGEPDERGAA